MHRSGEHVGADGAVERWNPQLARWERASVQPRAIVAPLPSGSAPALQSAPQRVPRPPRRGARLYAGARSTLAAAGFGSGGDTSADAELHSSLAKLRARARQLVRDSAYAKRARTLIVNNVIGCGVGMEAQVVSTRNGLRDDINQDIEDAWCEWCDRESCHTGGALHFGDLERAAMGQVFEAGEVLVRIHPARLGRSAVPMALELIEPERLADDYAFAPAAASGNEIRLGVEVNAFGRPVAYWLRPSHRGDLARRYDMGGEKIERVPAEQIMHLRIVDRWPQTRGEPWLHAVLRKLDALAEYSQCEVDAARASAAYFATIESPEAQQSTETDEDDAGAPLMDIQPLTVQALDPGEKLTFHSPNRPNTALDPFMRAMLREVAAGAGTSYESLSRDYSQSNYSSSRLALLDDRDTYRALQQWWVRSFRAPLHRMWLQQAVLARVVRRVPLEEYAVDPAKFEAVLWKPRGWSWVDPTREVQAYKEAIRGGLTTLTDVIAQTADGRAFEDIVKTRRRELDALAKAGLDVDTTPEVGSSDAAGPPSKAPAAGADESGGAGQGAQDGADTEGARVMRLRARGVAA